MDRESWLLAWAQERAAAKRRWAGTGVDWLVGIAISGNGDCESHPDEERFDFPCSATWRDYYNDQPELSSFFPLTQKEERLSVRESFKGNRGVGKEGQPTASASSPAVAPPPRERSEERGKEVGKEVRNK